MPAAALRPSRITWLVAEALFYFPWINELLSWNNTRSVSASNMKRFLARRRNPPPAAARPAAARDRRGGCPREQGEGRNVALLPGGFEEATLYRRGRFRVYIKRRKARAVALSCLRGATEPGAIAS